MGSCMIQVTKRVQKLVFWSGLQNPFSYFFIDEPIICIHKFLFQCDYPLHQIRLKSLVLYIDR